MAQIGRKIYYITKTGVVLCDTGERAGNVRKSTEAEDFAVFPQLGGIDPSTVSYIQLTYGEHDDEFANMQSMSVDPTTKVLTITTKATMTTNTTIIS